MVYHRWIDENHRSWRNERERWALETEEKRVNAFMDGDEEDAIDYNDDDPEDEEVYGRSSSFHMMKKIQTMKRWSQKHDLKSMKSYQMIWSEKLN